MSDPHRGRPRPRVVDVVVVPGEEARAAARVRSATEAKAAADEARNKPTIGASIGERILAKDPGSLLRLAATGSLTTRSR